MIRVLNDVPVQEVNGKELPIGESRAVTIASHPFKCGVVRIGFGDVTVAVFVSELHAAIDNANNCAR